MIDISVGAVGAAIIAGLVSFLGLIIGKEQKVSEFRQSWINDLRGCITAYLVNINAICDALRVQKSNGSPDKEKLLPNYKLLNEASLGIKLRVNAKEKHSKRLLKTMKEFETIAQKNADLTPENIDAIEGRFIEKSQELLKFEWNRVKRGENIYVWSKRIVAMLTTILIIILLFLWMSQPATLKQASKPPIFLSLQDIPLVFLTSRSPR